MKLTGSVSYAVGVLLQIQELAGEGQITAARIARGCRFPPRFLYRILRRLVDAGLLSGTSGPGGGYALARPATRISLLDIVTAVEAHPEASTLKPVSGRQRKAVQQINRICEVNAKRFAADLRRLNLAKLAKAGGRKAKKKKASV